MTLSRRDLFRRLAAAGLVAGMAETERRYWWLGRWAEPTPDHRAFAALTPGPESEQRFLYPGPVDYNLFRMHYDGKQWLIVGEPYAGILIHPGGGIVRFSHE